MNQKNHPSAVTNLDHLMDDNLKFGCIYADPPWPYSRNPRGAATRHYSTMSMESLKALPVDKLAANQAHLHLWTTNSFMKEAHELMEAWGFDYKSMFTWVKFQIGTGYYWRGATEHLLLGVKGGQRFLHRGMRNWMLLDREHHSKKPEVVRRLIEQVSPGPYLELFGRRVTENWVVFGNQVQQLPTNAPVAIGKTTTIKKLQQQTDLFYQPPPNTR
jgi:N6-adenosine-specific RNA methylase IME4